MKSKFINTICLPIRLFLSHKRLNKLGLRSLKDERYDIVIKHSQGRLLDIGCGDNQLVKKYGQNSIGIDIQDNGEDVLVVKDSANLPFKDQEFDTVSIVGTLNYISNQKGALKEAHRVLKKNGLLLITMINPIAGYFRHKLAWWDTEQHKDIWHKSLITMIQNEGFSLKARKRFVLKLNNLYIFKKA